MNRNHREKKKEFEAACFAAFRTKVSLGPVVSWSQPEPPDPDILVATSEGNVGIEITRLVISEPKKENQVVAKNMIQAAGDEWSRLGKPPVDVLVYLGNELAMSKEVRKSLVSALLEQVSSSMPKVGCVSELRCADFVSDILTRHLERLRIHRPDHDCQNHWNLGLAAFIPEIGSERIERELADKASAQTRHKGLAKDWLLIVSESGFPASWFTLSSEAKSHTYVTMFDRVFVMPQFPSELIELRITTPGKDQYEPLRPMRT